MGDASKRVDAVVVGAGFGGMYMAHLLRNMNMDVFGIERGSGVGGTWFWNRYPGCRCDVESMEYSYQFSEELQQSWQWSERYSPQPEILAYANHVAQRFDLESIFRFNATVQAAGFNQNDDLWSVSLDSGEVVLCRYLIMATGCLSAANMPNFEGMENFAGQIYHTGSWPAEGVDFNGKRVAIIGTGSSAIQSIPFIAQQAKKLTVFQRTPNYSVPAQNKPIDQDLVAAIKADYVGFRQRNKLQPAAFGADYSRHSDSVLDATPEQREQRFEAYWNDGGFAFLAAFGDITSSEEANYHAAEFVRNKIRNIVNNPQTAELLCPDTILGCKRLVADSGYFETFNRENVSLVDVSENGIEKLNGQGIVVNGQDYAADVIVFATGFDAMTGALLKINICGVDGLSLRDKWSAGPRTYLGLMTAGFPNLFMMTGPGSPSVLANMVTGVEQHAEYISEMIRWACSNDRTQIVPHQAAEDEWVELVNMRSEQTLYPRCNSWYLGANVVGKPRVFMPYIGFPDYVQRTDEIRQAQYQGFSFKPTLLDH